MFEGAESPFPKAVSHFESGRGGTKVARMVTICKDHHRIVHEGGRKLVEQPDGKIAAVPH